MIQGNTASIVTASRREVAAGSPGDRLPSVRELMARHRAGPATVQRAIAALSARGARRGAPGPGTFVARASRSATAAADTSWQTVALGARAIDADALETLLRPPPPGALVLSSGYLPADLQPHGRARRGAGPRGAAAGRVGPGAAGGHRAACARTSRRRSAAARPPATC